MKRLLTAALFLLPALVWAEEEDEPALIRKADPASKDSGAMSLLPVGSVLDGVMLPRYGKNLALSEVVHAKRMTIRAPGVIFGETVMIDFFGENHEPKGRIQMPTAVFDQETGILRSEDPSVIKTPRFTAEGRSLIYASKEMKGFLSGPASSRLYHPADPASSMNLPKPLRATALVGASLVPFLTAAPAPDVPAEAAAAPAETASKAAFTNAENQKTRDLLREDLKRSAAATEQAAAFLDQADMLAKESPESTPPPDFKPLEVTPSSTDTVVNCDGGIYYDSTNGVLMYLRNVIVKDPRFDLSGADELKVFFAKKPEKTEKTAEPKQETGAGNFGEAEKLIATGAVRVLKKADKPGDEPIEASGAVLTYNIKTGDITITGGYPWVKQGTRYSRALRPNETLRLYRSGDFVTEGQWQMGGPLQDPTDEKKPKTGN
ncbi:MAG: hypothetical protein QM680_06495 [Luteolibacter sp.]